MAPDIRAPRLVLASILSLALLSACGDDAGEEAAGAMPDDGREASGEILPSSISDDMIATDQLDSQPPLLQDEPVVASAASGSEGSQGDGEAVASDPVEPQPEPEPLTVEDIALPED